MSMTIPPFAGQPKTEYIIYAKQGFCKEGFMTAGFARTMAVLTPLFFAIAFAMFVVLAVLIKAQ